MLQTGCVELFTVTVEPAPGTDRLLALFNSNTMLTLWWFMKGRMGQHFCNAIVWIAELVR